MKKILVLLLTAVMLFALAACGEDTSTADTTGTAQTESPETMGGDTTTAAPDTDGETDKTTDTDKATETEAPEHTHSYSSATTKQATCGEDGTKTFTCSCGDTYTEKIAATGQHSWDDWKTETQALVGKEGIEKRTCKTCFASETRKTTEDALNNSFVDNVEFEWFMSEWPSTNGGTLVDIPYNVEGIQGGTLLNYLGAVYNESDRTDMDFTISFSNSVTYLSTKFNITDSLKTEMKADYRYDSATDSFNLTYPGSSGIVIAWVEGYIHNGGNNYTVYYGIEQRDGGFIPQYWKAEIEYNLLNGNPNKYLSFMGVETLPSDLAN